MNCISDSAPILSLKHCGTYRLQLIFFSLRRLQKVLSAHFNHSLLVLYYIFCSLMVLDQAEKNSLSHVEGGGMHSF